MKSLPSPTLEVIEGLTMKTQISGLSGLRYCSVNTRNRSDWLSTKDAEFCLGCAKFYLTRETGA